MMKVLPLTENDIERIVNLVLEEELDVEGYGEFDFLDIFLRTFKNWIESTKNIDMSKFPLSYLLKKHGKQFLSVHGLLDPDDVDNEDFEISRWAIPNYGKDLLKKGVSLYPSLREEGKFTERFGKAIERFIKMQNLPNYAEIEITEPKPFVLRPKVKIDLLNFLKANDNYRSGKHTLDDKFEEFIRNFLGMDITSPEYGGVTVLIANVEILGKDEFVKNVVNGDIKKKIKQLPNSNLIHRMTLEISEEPRVTLKLIFKYGGTWENKRNLKNQAEEIIKNLGFDTRKFKVES